MAQPSTAEYSPIQYSTAQHRQAQPSTIEYSTVKYNIAQYRTAQYSPAQHSTTAQYSECENRQNLKMSNVLYAPNAKNTYINQWFTMFLLIYIFSFLLIKQIYKNAGIPKISKIVARNLTSPLAQQGLVKIIGISGILDVCLFLIQNIKVIKMRV